MNFIWNTVNIFGKIQDGGVFHENYFLPSIFRKCNFLKKFFCVLEFFENRLLKSTILIYAAILSFIKKSSCTIFEPQQNGDFFF
jgi:hypothetical protein